VLGIPVRADYRFGTVCRCYWLAKPRSNHNSTILTRQFQFGGRHHWDSLQCLSLFPTTATPTTAPTPSTFPPHPISGHAGQHSQRPSLPFLTQFFTPPTCPYTCAHPHTGATLHRDTGGPCPTTHYLHCLHLVPRATRDGCGRFGCSPPRRATATPTHSFWTHHTTVDSGLFCFTFATFPA